MIVESGTDVRIVEGLSQRCEMDFFARRIVGGCEVSHPPAVDVKVLVGPPGRLAFAWQTFHRVRKAPRDSVNLVQGYGLAALATNLGARLGGSHAVMLVCSPIEAYYECRRRFGNAGQPYSSLTLSGLRSLAWVNARIGQRYVVLSHHLEQVVREHGGSLPIHTIPIYGVDTAVFTPRTRDLASLRLEHGLPVTGAIVLFSSRIAPEKDGESVLEAIRRLRDAGRDIWVLHRSGGYRQFIAYAERLGIADRVIATDAVHPLTGVPSDMRVCDVCIQASRAEGLGFSPLEALACEVPVVASAVGGLMETIRDGETGWTYPVGDADALAAQVAAVLDNPAEGRRRAANGRRFVQERFESSVVFNRFAELLATLNDGRGTW